MQLIHSLHEVSPSQGGDEVPRTTSNTSSATTLSADSYFEIGMRFARYTGFGDEASRDFAVKFVQHMLNHESQLPAIGQAQNAFLWRCAHNLMIDELRHENHIRSHECVLTSDGRTDFELADIGTFRTPLPERAVLQTELISTLTLAIASLEAHPQYLFVSHYIDGFTFAELSKSSNQSYDAVRMTVSRAKHHVLANLKRKGIDETEMMEYLELLASGECAVAASELHKQKM